MYASPMRVAVNLDSSRASNAEPEKAYPDICFALDSFDEGQHNMVRTVGFKGFGSLQRRLRASRQACPLVDPTQNFLTRDS